MTEETGDDDLSDVGSVGTARTAHPHHSEDVEGKGVDSWKGLKRNLRQRRRLMFGCL